MLLRTTTLQKGISSRRLRTLREVSRCSAYTSSLQLRARNTFAQQLRQIFLPENHPF